MKLFLHINFFFDVIHVRHRRLRGIMHGSLAETHSEAERSGLWPYEIYMLVLVQPVQYSESFYIKNHNCPRTA